MLETGLNPYGLTYVLGLQGQGTPRANPKGTGLEGFISIAQELNAKTLEIFEPWLAKMSDAELVAFRERLKRLGMAPVVSSGLQNADIGSCIRSARGVDAKMIRFALTPVLCGDGAVPFKELIAILGEHHGSLPAVLEPGALEARHVRLFTRDWWKGYAPKSAESLAACLLAAQKNRLPGDADYRTPWERNDDAA